MQWRGLSLVLDRLTGAGTIPQVATPVDDLAGDAPDSRLPPGLFVRFGIVGACGFLLQVEKAIQHIMVIVDGNQGKHAMRLSGSVIEGIEVDGAVGVRFCTGSGCAAENPAKHLHVFAYPFNADAGEQDEGIGTDVWGCRSLEIGIVRPAWFATRTGITLEVGRC